MVCFLYRIAFQIRADFNLLCGALKIMQAKQKSKNTFFLSKNRNFCDVIADLLRKLAILIVIVKGPFK